MIRRKGYAELEHELAVVRAKYNALKRRLEAVAVIAIFGGVATWVIIEFVKWANCM